MSLWSILKAEYLTNENAAKNWTFIIMLIMMGLTIINLSHTADSKVKKITQLNKEIKAFRSEYVELKAKIMKKRMPSVVKKRLKEDGFYVSKKPPIKIIVENE